MSGKNKYKGILIEEWKQFFIANNMPVVLNPKVLSNKSSFQLSLYQDSFGYIHIYSRDKITDIPRDEIALKQFVKYNDIEVTVFNDSPSIMKALYFAHKGKRDYPEGYIVSASTDEDKEAVIDISTDALKFLNTLFMASQEQLDNISQLDSNLLKDIYIQVLKESYHRGYVDYSRVKAIFKSVKGYKLKSCLDDLELLVGLEYDRDMSRIFVQDKGLKMYTERECYDLLEG